MKRSADVVGRERGRVVFASRRMGVAMHEIAHVIAAESYGRSIRRVELTTDGGGQMWDSGPRRRTPWRTAAWEEAVIYLAGPVCTERWAAAALWTARDGRGCESDWDGARAAARRAGVPIRLAQREAVWLVRTQWTRINARAVRLYKKGHL